MSLFDRERGTGEGREREREGGREKAGERNRWGLLCISAIRSDNLKLGLELHCSDQYVPALGVAIRFAQKNPLSKQLSARSGNPEAHSLLSSPVTGLLQEREAYHRYLPTPLTLVVCFLAASVTFWRRTLKCTPGQVWSCDCSAQ